MRRTSAMVAVVALLAMAGGCERDGLLLWQPAAGGAGATSAAGAGLSIGTGPVTNQPYPSNGSTGGVTPPRPMQCPPFEPICMCADRQSCVCDSEPEDQCTVVCEGDNCGLECLPFTSCDLGCEFGCFTTCHPGANCLIHCEDGCDVACMTGAECTLWSSTGLSTMYCEEDSSCDCQPNAGCECVGPGCPQ